MSSDSDMEQMRPRIRAALAADPSKSQKELANLLGVSPAQVTSLLKPGGRRLQASEVPIVEQYLGIRIFQGLENVSRVAAYRAASAQRRSDLPLKAEAALVALDDAPEEIRGAMTGLAQKESAECWRLSADVVRDAGYVPGDYLIVDRSEAPRNGDLVLAEFRQSAGRWIPFFRVYVPPVLQVMNSRSPPESGLSLSDRRIAVIGPVIASFRSRQGR